jgi:26S proteasome regulatory subunit N11
VKGKVVIDAFRLHSQQVMMTPGAEPRQTTANIGMLNKASLHQRARGLDKYYYSLAINYRKNDFEMKMLVNMNKVAWSDSLKVQTYD